MSFNPRWGADSSLPSLSWIWGWGTSREGKIEEMGKKGEKRKRRKGTKWTRENAPEINVWLWPWCATLAPAVLELSRILSGPAWGMNAGARQSAEKLFAMPAHLWCGFNQQQHHITDVTSIPRCLSVSWRWLHGATVHSANASISDVAGVRFALTYATQSRRWGSMTRSHLSSSRCDSWQGGGIPISLSTPDHP